MKSSQFVSVFVSMLICILTVLMIPSCDTTDSDDASNIGSDITRLNDTANLPENYYYDEEIFPDNYMAVYSSWVPSSLCGGDLAVSCTDSVTEDYDLLKIEETGIFKMFKNNELVLFGKIILYYVQSDIDDSNYPVIILSVDKTQECDDTQEYTFNGEEVCYSSNGIELPSNMELSLSEDNSFLYLNNSRDTSLKSTYTFARAE